jgi:putative ABC transport system permease protein
VFALSFVLAALLNAVLVGLITLFAINGPLADSGATDVVVSEPGGAGTLRLADSAALAQQFGTVATISPVVAGLEPVVTLGRGVQAQVQGVGANYQQVGAWQMELGTFFTQQDDVNLNRVAVINDSLARQLFAQDTSSAVGATIRIRDIPFSVIGVGSDGQPTALVLVPFRTAQIRLYGPTALNQVVLHVSSANQASAVGQQVEQLLRRRHNLRPGQADDFSVSDARLAAPTSVWSASRFGELLQEFACVAKSACPRSNT